jgi:hypothetical protein
VLSDRNVEDNAFSTGSGWNTVASPDLLARLMAVWNDLTDTDRLDLVAAAERIAGNVSID